MLKAKHLNNVVKGLSEFRKWLNGKPYKNFDRYASTPPKFGICHVLYTAFNRENTGLSTEEEVAFSNLLDSIIGEWVCHRNAPETIARKNITYCFPISTTDKSAGFEFGNTPAAEKWEGRAREERRKLFEHIMYRLAYYASDLGSLERIIGDLNEVIEWCDTSDGEPAAMPSFLSENEGVCSLTCASGVSILGIRERVIKEWIKKTYPAETISKHGIIVEYPIYTYCETFACEEYVGPSLWDTREKRNLRRSLMWDLRIAYQEYLHQLQRGFLCQII